MSRKRGSKGRQDRGVTHDHASGGSISNQKGARTVLRDKSGRTSGPAGGGGSSRDGGLAEAHGDVESAAKRHGTSDGDSTVDFRDGQTGGNPDSLTRDSLMSMLDQVPDQYRAYQSEHKFRNTVEQWNFQMDNKDYEGQPLNHQESVFRYYNIWCRLRDALQEMPNPFADAIPNKALACSDIAEARLLAYALNLAQGDWLGAPLDFLEATDDTGESEADTQETQKKLHDHWCDTYEKNSLEGLRATIDYCQKEWLCEYATNYSKSINIFQSSGMGKS